MSRHVHASKPELFGKIPGDFFQVGRRGCNHLLSLCILVASMTRMVIEINLGSIVAFFWLGL